MYKLRNKETGEIIFKSKLKWECEYREMELTLYRPGLIPPSLEIIEEPDQPYRPPQEPCYMLINTATGRPIFSSPRKSDCEYKAYMLKHSDPDLSQADLIVVNESEYYTDYYD